MGETYLHVLLPGIILFTGAVIAIVSELFNCELSRKPWMVLITALSLGSFSMHPAWSEIWSLENKLCNDFGIFMCGDLIALLFGMLIVFTLFVVFILRREGDRDSDELRHPLDLDFLITCSTLGALVMTLGSHLITIFIGLELMSIPMYALSGIRREDKLIAESSVKYFFLGSVSSSMMLFGIAVIFSQIGSLSLVDILPHIADDSPGILLGVFFLLLGLLFKLGVFPWHFWTPDVYSAVRSRLMLFLSTVSKLAIVSVFTRVIISSDFLFQETVWPGVLWTLSLVSIVFGTFGALGQRSVKRLLGYSAISHAGYFIIGFLGITDANFGSLWFYCFSYILMNLAAFGALDRLLGDQSDSDFVELLNRGGDGISRAMIFITFLSLAGIPPTIGFFAKLLIFIGAIRTGYEGLVFIAAICSVVSFVYYLLMGTAILGVSKNKHFSTLPF